MSVKNAHNTFLVFKNKLDTAQGSNLVDGKFIKKTALKNKYIQCGYYKNEEIQLLLIRFYKHAIL